MEISPKSYSRTLACCELRLSFVTDRSFFFFAKQKPFIPSFGATASVALLQTKKNEIGEARRGMTFFAFFAGLVPMAQWGQGSTEYEY